MSAAFFIVPLLLASVCFFGESKTLRRMLLIGGALFHSALTAAAWFRMSAFNTNLWIRLDHLGLVVLTVLDVLFLASAFYALGYLRGEADSKHWDRQEKLFFKNISEQVFCGCLFLFLAAMSLACVSRHFGLLWIALETTTLVSAPLVCFHKHHRSLEAAWKYLIICSVGIALGLLGTLFLAASAVASGYPHILLTVDRLLEVAPQLNPFWLKLAFIFVLVGFGTKMGLAPFHSWLPDAHSEAPSLVSVLLSGALLNCAFLGILRTYEVIVAAGLSGFAQSLLLAFGIVSLIAATFFIIRQRDFKRMLAYSSVEHMGILSFAIGLGGAGAIFGALLHLINHSLAKGMLFMAAGNLQRTYGTKLIRGVRGAARVAPFSAALWMMGFLAITGTPPFGIFVSKFIILRAAFEMGYLKAGFAALVLITVVFFSISALVIKMIYGERPSDSQLAAGQAVAPEPLLLVLPPLVLLILTLVLGIYLPPSLKGTLQTAAIGLGG